jgi:hypothetical protein
VFLSRAIFDVFLTEFAKYFLFLGIFDGDRGRFDEKMVRFCQKASKIVKYHCSLLSTAVCTCFLRKCGRFEVIRDFRSLENGGIPFPVDRSIAEKM